MEQRARALAAAASSSLDGGPGAQQRGHVADEVLGVRVNERREQQARHCLPGWPDSKAERERAASAGVTTCGWQASHIAALPLHFCSYLSSTA